MASHDALSHRSQVAINDADGVEMMIIVDLNVEPRDEHLAPQDNPLVFLDISGLIGAWRAVSTRQPTGITYERLAPGCR